MTLSPTKHPLSRLLRKHTLRVLGINTGTSIDGLDLALVSIRNEGTDHHTHPIITHSYRIPPALKRTLQELASSPSVNKEIVAITHHRFGAWIGDTVRRFRDKGHSIDLVGCHGQTIGHFPRRQGRGSPSTHATWQIGSPAAIAHRSGLPTIADFRSADIAAGGMGAPLSGYYHHLLFGPLHVVLNLGGIANVSASRTRRRNLEILAFDTGPGNMISDGVAQSLLRRPYDPGGRIALSGRVDSGTVRRMLRRRYFQHIPPKTCGREQFGMEAIRSALSPIRWTTRMAPDLLATAVAISVGAICHAIRTWVEPFTPSRTLVVGGGGVRNRALLAGLIDGLPNWKIQTTAELGYDPLYVEPIGFALLAFETIHARPGNRGGATGAGAEIPLGTISLP